MAYLSTNLKNNEIFSETRHFLPNYTDDNSIYFSSPDNITQVLQIESPTLNKNGLVYKMYAYGSNTLYVLKFKLSPGRIAQLVRCPATDASLTAECISRGHKVDPGPVTYFRGDWS